MPYYHSRHQQNNRHRVFVSYYHNDDQDYRERFELLFSDIHDIMVSESVEIGDIDPYLKTETIRQKIRDEYLQDSTVTVVLVGPHTWQRKFVDWEIGSSIRHTEKNNRSGLLGILLPTHTDSGRDRYTAGFIPPRLHDNIACGFAKLYNWNNDPHTVSHGYTKLSNGDTRIHRPITLVFPSKTTVRAKGGNK